MLLWRIWASSSFLRHYDEAQILLNLQPQFCAIGADGDIPYERPPLSKAVLTEAGQPVPKAILADEQREALGLTYAAGVAANALDRAAHQLSLSDGRTITYSKLLLATGASPRRLPFAAGARMHYLRTHEDALAIRAALRPGGHLVVVGGGFIGLEVAASARSLGVEVTVIEQAERLLMRAVPADLADALAARHKAEGVQLRVGQEIKGISATSDGVRVTLASGSVVVGDAVVVGVGAIPNTGLARDAELTVANGIVVDEFLRTSDPAIYAAGDCAAFPHPLFGGRRIRLEAWRNAFDQGRHAARNMMGADAPFDTVPWFWSDQYDQALQIAGLVDEGSSVVPRALSDDASINFHLSAEGRIVAVSALGPNGKIAKEVRLAERLIAMRCHPAVAELADPAVRLKTMLRAAETA